MPLSQRGKLVALVLSPLLLWVFGVVLPYSLTRSSEKHEFYPTETGLLLQEFRKKYGINCWPTQTNNICDLLDVVECDYILDKKVTTIITSFTQIREDFHPPPVGNLSDFLQDLLLFQTKEIFSLEHLTILRLADAGTGGTIPTELGEFKSLHILELSGNHLIGPIPTELGNLKDLQWLSLQGNKLSGSLPSELGDLQHLESLYLSSNQLSGSIPSELGNIQLLEMLTISFNQLRGTIPTELGNLEHLKVIDISSNFLEGEIPVSLTKLKHLEDISLEWNDPLVETYMAKLVKDPSVKLPNPFPNAKTFPFGNRQGKTIQWARE